MTPHPYAHHVAEIVWRRRDALGLTQKQVAAAGGLSIPTYDRFEKATITTNVQPDTLSKVDKALQWAEGTMRGLLQGGQAPAEPEIASALPQEVKEMLAQIDRLRRLTRPVELPADVQEALIELTDQAADMQLRLIGQLGD